MKRRLLGALAWSWVLAIAGTAQAGPITFVYEGTVGYLVDGLGTLPSGITLGADFKLRYTFESTTPDVNWFDPALGQYTDAFSDFTVAIGGVTFSMNSSGSGHIFVYDNFTGSYDGVHSQQVVEGAYGYSTIYGIGRFEDHSQTAFVSDDLPLAPLFMADFDSTYLQLWGYGQALGVYNYVDIRARDVRLVPQLVAIPEPSSITLFGAGLAALGWLSKRRKLGQPCAA